MVPFRDYRKPTVRPYAGISVGHSVSTGTSGSLLGFAPTTRSPPFPILPDANAPRCEALCTPKGDEVGDKGDCLTLPTKGIAGEQVGLTTTVSTSRLDEVIQRKGVNLTVVNPPPICTPDSTDSFPSRATSPEEFPELPSHLSTPTKCEELVLSLRRQERTINEKRAVHNAQPDVSTDSASELAAAPEGAEGKTAMSTHTAAERLCRLPCGAESSRTSVSSGAHAVKFDNWR